MTRLTLLLARSDDKPLGDIDDRLVMELRLTNSGHIDIEAFFGSSMPWLARREVRGQVHSLEIIRIDEGWALQSADSSDDPIWTVHGTIFRPGELVCVSRGDRHEDLFRIVAAEPQDGAGAP